MAADLPIATPPLSPDRQELVRRLLSGRIGTARSAPLDELGFAGPAEMIEHDEPGRFDPFPLTEMQQAYWVGRQRSLELGDVAIHSYIELQVESLDVERLEAAWNAVIARHDMLRAIVRPDGRQQVLRDVEPYRIAATVCASDAAHEIARAQRRADMSHTVFKTDSWPLFALAVTRGPAAGSILHVSIDGVLLDAWSLSAVINECLQLYDDPARRLPDAGITFRDYVLAEQRDRDRLEYQASLAWWRQRLEALPGAPDLPLVKPPRLVRSGRFVRRSGELAADDWRRLRRRIGDQGLTASSLLLAAYAEVLSSWSADTRFTINVPRFDRPPVHPSIDEVVGEFASFTLIPCDCSRRATMLERARQVQQRMWEAIEHGRVSGLTLVRELMRRRGRGAASFPVVFTANPTLGAHRPRQVQTSFGGRVVHAITQTPQVWLDFQIGERDGCLAFNWDAVDELFPPGMLDQMNAAFSALLSALAREDGGLDIERPDERVTQGEVPL
jgi:Condensation domain